MLMENQLKKDVYTTVVRAGGGMVMVNWTIHDLLSLKPGPELLTHIVVDPSVMKPDDYRHEKFKEWCKYADTAFSSVQRQELHIYYKYFFERISRPELGSLPSDFNIYRLDVIEMARANDDFQPTTVARDRRVISPPTLPQVAPPRERISAKRSSDGAEGDKCSAKKARTLLRTTLVPANVVELSDSDDDIEILEQKLLQEKGTKRIYYQSKSTTANQFPDVILLDDSVDLDPADEDDDDNDDVRDLNEPEVGKELPVPMDSPG
jgi:hypothetical protein